MFVNLFARFGVKIFGVSRLKRRIFWIIFKNCLFIVFDFCVNMFFSFMFFYLMFFVDNENDMLFGLFLMSSSSNRFIRCGYVVRLNIWKFKFMLYFVVFEYCVSVCLLSFVDVLNSVIVLYEGVEGVFCVFIFFGLLLVLLVFFWSKYVVDRLLMLLLMMVMCLLCVVVLFFILVLFVCVMMCWVLMLFWGGYFRGWWDEVCVDVNVVMFGCYDDLILVICCCVNVWVCVMFIWCVGWRWFRIGVGLRGDVLRGRIEGRGVGIVWGWLCCCGWNWWWIVMEWWLWCWVWFWVWFWCCVWFWGRVGGIVFCRARFRNTTLWWCVCLGMYYCFLCWWWWNFLILWCLWCGCGIFLLLLVWECSWSNFVSEIRRSLFWILIDFFFWVIVCINLCFVLWLGKWWVLCLCFFVFWICYWCLSLWRRRIFRARSFTFWLDWIKILCLNWVLLLGCVFLVILRLCVFCVMIWCCVWCYCLDFVRTFARSRRRKSNLRRDAFCMIVVFLCCMLVLWCVVIMLVFIV